MAVATTGQPLIDVASLPPEMAMMRLENDNIQAMAVARPRDYQEIKQAVLDQIKAFPAFASQIIYCKPVGKNDAGKQQFARSLSIRAAECLAEAYGFNRVASTITPIDDDHASVEATFVDYQRGRIWQDRRVVSRVYKTRGGGTARHPEDRFYGVVCGAEASRRIREVVLRSVPPGLKQELFDAAEKEMRKLLDPKKIKEIIDAFAGKGVSLEMLEAYLGRTVKQGWTDDDKRTLAETWAAIRNEDATIEEIFGHERGPQQPSHPTGESSHPAGNGIGRQANGSTAKPGEVTADHLMHPQGGAEKSPEVDEPPPKNPKGQVGPDKPEPVLEREPGDDGDEEAGYGDTATVEELPDWAQAFWDELQATDKIREMKAIGQKYAADPARTQEDREWIESSVAQAQDQERSRRGERSNAAGD